jgi:hypothetical protein
MRPLRVAALLVSAIPLTHCGARSSLDVGAGGNDASVASTDDGSTLSTDAALPHDGALVLHDRCPSAVQVGAPLSVVGNCSTRDGRARLAGPKAPRVTWTIADTDFEQEYGFSLNGIAAADGLGGVYLGSNAEQAEPTLVRIAGATGTIDWRARLSGLVLDAFFMRPQGLEALSARGGASETDHFDPSTGAITATGLGRTYNQVALPALGAEGSLYVASLQRGADPGEFYIAISRILPDSTAAWTVGAPSPDVNFRGFAWADGPPSPLLTLGRSDVVLTSVLEEITMEVGRSTQTRGGFCGGRRLGRISRRARWPWPPTAQSSS